MNTNTLRFRLAGLALLALWAVLAPQAMAQEDDVKVFVKKMADCEGDDCEALHEKRMNVFIDESGHVEVLGGDGSHVWVSGEHGDGEFVFRTAGSKGGFLGVQLTELNDELRAHFNVGADGGVMVSKVVDDSAAFRAGLEVGDIVSAVNGETVSSSRSLSRAISSHEEGETVDLEVWRDGRVQTLSATLGEHDGAGIVRKISRQIKVECDDETGDCDVEGLHGLGGNHFKVLSVGDFDCGSDDCKIEVQCSEENDCVCTVNGEETDCDELGH